MKNFISHIFYLFCVSEFMYIAILVIYWAWRGGE